MTYNTKIGFKFEIKATLKTTTTNENKTKKLVFQASYFYY